MLPIELLVIVELLAGAVTSDGGYLEHTRAELDEGSALHRLRNEGKKSSITEERIILLESTYIGFEWVFVAVSVWRREKTRS
mmetsp:Transcript_22613/g.49102  ORF Transcript_22613/g.49102 Transcript_22613/m.49102 type:complete len:82 (+) Transcript_22613:450-695(+)